MNIIFQSNEKREKKQKTEFTLFLFKSSWIYLKVSINVVPFIHFNGNQSAYHSLNMYLWLINQFPATYLYAELNE